VQEEAACNRRFTKGRGEEKKGKNGGRRGRELKSEERIGGEEKGGGERAEGGGARAERRGRGGEGGWGGLGGRRTVEGEESRGRVIKAILGK